MSGTTGGETFPRGKTMSDRRVALEERHQLWRAHGTLLQDVPTRKALLILAPPKSGKSNIADRLLHKPKITEKLPEGSRWRLLTNDFLEWTVRGSRLYGGFRFSNEPAQFWFRDADGSKVYRDVWDSREWARIDSICSISATRSTGDVRINKDSDLVYWGDLKDGGRSGRWKSINDRDKGLPTEVLHGITMTLVLPRVLSETVFNAASMAIDVHFQPQEGKTREDLDFIAELNALYGNLDGPTPT